MKFQHLAVKHSVFRRGVKEASGDEETNVFARQKVANSAAAKTTTTTSLGKLLPTIPAKVTTTSTSAAVKTTSIVSKPTSVISTSSSSASASNSLTLSTSSIPSSILPTSSSTPVLPPNSSQSSLDRALSTSTTSSESFAPTHSSTLDKSVGDNNKTAQTSGLGMGGIIGIIAAVVGGLILIILALGFILRRMRKKRKGMDDFNAEKFRRSAVLLDEKEQAPLRPRPPTIIERKKKANNIAGLPPPPSLAYPYSDRSSVVASAPPSVYGSSENGHGMQPQQYSQFGSVGAQYGAALSHPVPPSPAPANLGGIPGAYGVPAPGAFAAQYEQAGYGAPPIPGTYGPGAYASYAAGSDPRYPHQHQRQQQQYQQQFYQPQQRPGQFGQQAYPGGNSNGFGAPNPHGQAPPSPTGTQTRTSLTSSGSGYSSNAPSLRQANSIDDDLHNVEGSGSAPPPAYDANEEEAAKWAARRDQKYKPVELKPPSSQPAGSSTTSSSSESALTGTVTPRFNARSNTGPRPISATSLAYNQDDAYGGM